MSDFTMHGVPVVKKRLAVIARPIEAKPKRSKKKNYQRDDQRGDE